MGHSQEWILPSAWGSPVSPTARHRPLPLRLLGRVKSAHGAQVTQGRTRLWRQVQVLEAKDPPGTGHSLAKGGWDPPVTSPLLACDLRIHDVGRRGTGILAVRGESREAGCRENEHREKPRWGGGCVAVQGPGEPSRPRVQALVGLGLL